MVTSRTLRPEDYKPMTLADVEHQEQLERKWQREDELAVHIDAHREIVSRSRPSRFSTRPRQSQ